MSQTVRDVMFVFGVSLITSGVFLMGAWNFRKVGRDDRLQVFLGKNKAWYWHRRAAGNNEVISTGGEGFTERRSACQGAFRANPDLHKLEVVTRITDGSSPSVVDTVTRWKSR